MRSSIYLMLLLPLVISLSARGARISTHAKTRETRGAVTRPAPSPFSQPHNRPSGRMVKHSPSPSSSKSLHTKSDSLPQNIKDALLEDLKLIEKQCQMLNEPKNLHGLKFKDSHVTEECFQKCSSAYVNALVTVGLDKDDLRAVYSYSLAIISSDRRAFEDYLEAVSYSDCPVKDLKELFDARETEALIEAFRPRA